MRKLLRADFMRLFHDKIFIFSCVAMFISGAALPMIHYFDKVNSGESWKPDATCFVFAFLVPIVFSLFTALFVGSEYSDGTIRNKITVGHMRHNIYLSKLTVCVTAGISLCIAYLVPHTVLSLALLGSFEAAPKVIFMYLGLNFALILAFAALFTLISMLCANKAYSAAACILLVFAMLFAGIRITSALNEPEYYSGYSYTENGVTTTEEAEKNPHYLDGAKRRIYELLQDLIPGGQAIQNANMNAKNPAMLAVYDASIVIFATVCGLIFFRRKNLK